MNSPSVLRIGHSGKYHNTLCLSPQALHKHCFCFLLGPLVSPKRNWKLLMQNLGGQTKSIMVFSGVANCQRFFSYSFMAFPLISSHVTIYVTSYRHFPLLFNNLLERCDVHRRRHYNLSVGSVHDFCSVQHRLSQTSMMPFSVSVC